MNMQSNQSSENPTGIINRIRTLWGGGIKGKVIILGGMVITFCLFCLCVILIFPSDTPQETNFNVGDIQTQTVLTIQAATTNTPLSTTTPPSTNTPLPTKTSVPSITQEPTIDSYEILFPLYFQEYADAYAEVQVFLEEVGNNLNLLFDDNWKLELGFALGNLNIKAEQLASLEPSPKYINLHAKFIELKDETLLFTDAYAKGVDNLDANMIDQANIHIQNITSITQQMTVELQSITNNP